MDSNDMLRALKALDKRLTEEVTLLIGGGAAMLLAYKVPLSTEDIDGLPLTTNISPAKLDVQIKAVAKELGISPHWYNSYFNTFTYTLPKDFRNRLVEIYKGKQLTAVALGLEDLLIMKCFAGREKDIGHARVLMRKKANLQFVEDHLYSLKEKQLPGSDEAIAFFEDLLQQEG